MVECPKCFKEIDCLYNIQSAIVRWDFFLDSKGQADYSHDPYFIDSLGESEYACPECGQTLTYDEDDAIRILRGEDV